jgi:excisionase family DNA binding protein
MDTLEKLDKAADIARRLNCGKSTIYNLAKAGKIPTVRIGKTGVRFDYRAVLQALQRGAGDQS